MRSRALSSCIVVLAAWGAFVPLTAQAPGPPEPSGVERLRERIDSIRSMYSIPGAQVALLTPDTTILWNFGVADPVAGTPVTDSTVFRIGSVTKSLAGISTLVLVERGLVALEDELARLAPELRIRNPWRTTRPVRVAHLLESTAGFVGFHSADFGVSAPPDISPRRVLAQLPYRRDVQWPPGEYAAYHNLGPVITAHLVEKISGRTYEDFVRESIFSPLGMTRSSFFLDEEVAGRLAYPPLTSWRREYLVEDGQIGDTVVDERVTSAAAFVAGARASGALISSAGDLASFVRMLLDRGSHQGSRLLSSDIVERFETPTTTLAARRLGIPRGYALNNWTMSYGGVLYHGHGGLFPPSYEAYYAYAPDAGTGFVYLGTWGPEGEVIHLRVAGAILDFLHPASGSSPERAPEPELLERLAGCYQLVNPEALDQRLDRARVGVQESHLRFEFMDQPDLTLELQPASTPSLFHATTSRPVFDQPNPWTEELVFVADDRGVLIAQFVSPPWDSYEPLPCEQEP